MPFRVVRAAIVFMLWSCLVFSAVAQEPEQFPPPKQAVPMPMPLAEPSFVPYPILPPPPPRLDSRMGWAYFAPNGFGQMRPRVVLSPSGAYYQYNGQPYPWTTTPRQQLLIMPKTSD
jgi:hypothetical protein